MATGRGPAEARCQRVRRVDAVSVRHRWQCAERGRPGTRPFNPPYHGAATACPRRRRHRLPGDVSAVPDSQDDLPTHRLVAHLAASRLAVRGTVRLAASVRRSDVQCLAGCPSHR